MMFKMMIRNRDGMGRLSSALLLGTVLSVGMSPVWPDVALAQGQGDAVQSFGLPQQPLRNAVAPFARAAGIDIVADGAIPVLVTAAPVSGNISVREGLDRLLTGTGYRYRFTGARSVLLISPAAAGAAAPVADGAVILDAIIINSGGLATEGSGSYASAQAGVVKGIADLREVPQSVSVVTRAQIEDQNLTTMTDVLDKTTGITLQRAGPTAGSNLGNDTNFYSRGFPVGNIRLDGGAPLETAMNGFGVTSNIDMAQYDHVEFLRGIDGLFSSTGDPGGTINLVRKKPLAERQTTYAISAGSWNNNRIEADTTGALNATGTIRGRIGGAWQDRDFFYDPGQMRTQLVYGALAFDLTPDTELTVGGSYNKTDGVPNFGGLPRYSSGQDLGLPRDTALVPDWAYTHDRSRELYATVEHRFDSRWSVSANFTHWTTKRDHSGAYGFGSVDPISGTGNYLYTYPEQNKMTRRALDISVTGGFDAFGRDHTLVFGIDYQKGHADSSQYMGYQGEPINPFDPVFPDQDLTPSPLKDSYYTTTRESAYGMTRLDLANGIHAVFGGRYSNYSYGSNSWETTGSGYVQGYRHLKDNGVFTPFLGFTYDLNGDWTAYASYAETYKPLYMQRKGPMPGTPLDPVTAKNYEIGLKGSVLGGKANTTLALYRVEQKGAAYQDPTYPPSYGAFNCCFLNRGDVTSTGFEAEIAGEVLDGWQVLAGYTWNATADKQESQSYSTITPKHQLKIWTSYDFADRLEGLTIGGGVIAQSATFERGDASTLNPVTGEWDGPSVPFEFSQGGYAIWSAHVGYDLTPDWSLALNVNNIFDKRYYSSLGTSLYGNFYGEQRNMMLSLKGKF